MSLKRKISELFYKLRERYKESRSKSKKIQRLSCELKATKSVLHKACEIITRFENRKPEIYICDCREKNQNAVNDFFDKVVYLKEVNYDQN